MVLTRFKAVCVCVCVCVCFSQSVRWFKLAPGVLHWVVLAVLPIPVYIEPAEL